VIAVGHQRRARLRRIGGHINRKNTTTETTALNAGEIDMPRRVRVEKKRGWVFMPALKQAQQTIIMAIKNLHWQVIPLVSVNVLKK
jgi:hypothetical protein